jgi:hypothetical protein
MSDLHRHQDGRCPLNPTEQKALDRMRQHAQTFVLTTVFWRQVSGLGNDTDSPVARLDTLR